MTSNTPICPPDSGGTCDNQFQAIYLGDVDSYHLIDADESVGGAESSHTLLGTTFGSAEEPLVDGIVTITANDLNDDDYLRGENGPGDSWGFETFTTDRPVPVEGPEGTDDSFNFDGVTQYLANITYLDGTTALNTLVTVMQDDEGRTFLVPNEGDNSALTAGPIQSLMLCEVATCDPLDNNLAICRPDIEFVPCFVNGTRILTAKGQRPVEKIAVGDLVETLDNGLQKVRWVGSRTLDAVDLAANPALRPIRIRRGVLGDRLPKRDLLVSPQHRVMVRSAVAQELFGADEVLVAAKHLLSLDGVEIAEDVTEVSYHHVLFDRHEVVFSEGAASESLFTGEQALKALGEAARTEIFTLFPELQNGVPGEGARPFLTGREGRGLVARHTGIALQ